MANPLVTDPTPPTPQPPPRLDRLSAWSLVLLGIVVLLQIVSQFNLTGRLSGGMLKSEVAPGKRADIKDVLEIDENAKWAYAAIYLEPGKDLPSLSKTWLDRAIKTAEGHFREFPSDREIARRVMILRAATGIQPLMGVTANRNHEAVPPPLTAFDSERPDQRAEADVWRTVFSYKKLPAGSDPGVLASKIEAISSLRWYKNVALQQLWQRAGLNERAKNSRIAAATDSFNAIAPLTVLYSLVLLISLAGITMLIGLAVRAALVRGVAKPERVSVFDAFAIPLPDPIEPAERRLGSGDQFNLFVTCMVLFVAISYVAEYVPIKLFPAAFAAMPQSHKINVVVSMLATSQALTTFLAVLIVLRYARSRGASVAKEIGLTFANPFKNALAGAVGWGISLPLILVSSKVALKLFPNTPDPSNPAIPLTIYSSGNGAKIALFFVICILAPIFEEIMFRGLFFQTARAKFGPWPAIVLTGIVFGLVHPVSIVGSIPLMVLGMVFAWLAETRKSLLPGMVAHSLQNTVSFLVMMFLS
ncbi:MAG TPA: CPBP family intramembrane glutamic endopeptidase [Capsulimonadaceae bacterium]|jgi:membrane protease YdiL (CAAX protease family)